MPEPFRGPDDPGIPSAGLTPPGSVDVPYQPLEVAELWRMVYDSPFTSHETQRIQQFFGNFSPSSQPELVRPVEEIEQAVVPPTESKRQREAKKYTSASPLGTANGITYTGQKFTHDTDGLPGYPAVDLFADPGTPFNAPENGRVIRLSGSGKKTGDVYGYSVYFRGESGRIYFITHLNKRRAPKGRYKRGDVLGTIHVSPKGAHHAHVGVKNP